MEDQFIQHLQKSNRPLGLKNTITLLLNGPGSLLGFITILIIIASILFDLHGSYIDYGNFTFGTKNRTKGSVIDTFDTNLEINERTVNGIVFSYSVNDIEMQNTSFATEWYPATNTLVEIEYLKSDPSLARIVNTTYSKFGLLALVLFGIGIVLAIISIIRFIKSLRWIKLLQNGKFSYATLISSRPTNTTINDQRVMALEFAYKDETGKEHRWTVKTHNPEDITDDKRELILYDAKNAGISPLLIDQMPVCPEVNSLGWVSLPWLKLLLPLTIKVGIPATLVWIFIV